MARTINRVLAFVVGAALLAGGLLVGIEAVWAWTGSGFLWIPGHAWLTSFKTTAWSDSLVIAISVGVGVLGLVLLVGEIRPQRERVAEFKTDHGTWLLARRSTEAHLSRRLAAAVSTSPIKTQLKPRSARWRLKVSARAAASTHPTLEEVARSELDSLRAPPTRVRVKATGARTP